MCDTLKQWGRKALGVIGVSAVAVGSASAAVPAGVETMFTGIATDFGTVLGYGYTLMLAIVGGLIIIKVVKKVANRAS